MSKIYFICGFIGSGKTTYSKKLAVEKSAFRFSIDEWMIPLYGDHMEREVFNERLGTLQGLFKTSALQMLSLNVPVIFDFGFWTKYDRISILNWANEYGLDCEFIYIDASFEKCSERVIKRNIKQDQMSYNMTPEMLNLFWSWFEIPSDECVTAVSL
ncbi:MAG: ATP-binding protein [Alteromonadales bacterium]|nr:ATP-binding protein [Alteromonadales bacterium]